MPCIYKPGHLVRLYLPVTLTELDVLHGWDDQFLSVVKLGGDRVSLRYLASLGFEDAETHEANRTPGLLSPTVMQCLNPAILDRDMYRNRHGSPEWASLREGLWAFFETDRIPEIEAINDMPTSPGAGDRAILRHARGTFNARLADQFGITLL